MKNILAALDFSDVTSPVLAAASAQARAFGAKLHLVHVWDPEVLVDSGYGAEPALALNVQEERLDAMKQRLADEIAKLKADGLDADGLVLTGRPQKVLAKHGREIGADLVVIGSHGHTALGSLLMGSCASALVRKSCFPLLVVPALDADEERE